MASTPLFVSTAFGTLGAASFSALVTSPATGAGATAIVTGGTNGSIVRGIRFTIPTNANATMLLIYYNDTSSKYLYDYVTVDPRNPGSVPAPGNPPWTATWINPNPDPLKATYQFMAGAVSGTNLFKAVALGGDA